MATQPPTKINSAFKAGGLHHTYHESLKLSAWDILAHQLQASCLHYGCAQVLAHMLLVGVSQRSARSIFQLSRREREFLIFNLAHRDETENFCHLISCFETRPRIISFNLRHRDEIENFHDLFSVFETRTRNFDIAISSREIGFCSTFLHANLVKYFLSDPSGPGVWYMGPAIYLSLKGLTISQNFCGITKEFFAS